MKLMTENIKHHLSDDLLMAYSAGTLPEAFSLMVASHVSLCDVCRAQLETFDAVGGALLEDETTEMGEDSLAATIAMISGHAPQPRAPRKRPGVLPGPLQETSSPIRANISAFSSASVASLSETAIVTGTSNG